MSRTLADLQAAARAADLVFGVDLAARDTATIGGMASTNAGGLRTVRYGNMGEQILGLDIALPDGSIHPGDATTLRAMGRRIRNSGFPG